MSEELDALRILQGDAVERLRTLPSESVQCCVTSPPYWGLRDYSSNGQLGLEKTPDEYVVKMVEVFREVRRVLRKDGTLWLNLGDTYAAQRGATAMPAETLAGGISGRGDKDAKRGRESATCNHRDAASIGLKHKDLCGIPWRVAFALQADGWWLRSDIIWAKPNPMPESVTDRPTKAHEYLFLLTKSANYYYDSEAIQEKAAYDGRQDTLLKPSEKYSARNIRNEGQPNTIAEVVGQRWRRKHDGTDHGGNGTGFQDHSGYDKLNHPYVRNKRSVWTVATAPYPEAHFATYPPDLIKPCIMAGTSAKGCCAKCGAPWERIVKSVPSISKDCPKTIESHYARGGTGLPCGTVGQSGSGRINGYSETLGWQPTCKCKHGTYAWDGVDVKPCTVLDPFAGSGTTGAVALELGRKAILIELNPKYVALIEQRCNVTMGLALA